MKESFIDGLLNNNPKTLAIIYNGSIGDIIRKDVCSKGGSQEDAEDVLVLAILRAQKLIANGKYQAEGKFDAFLRNVAYWIWREELKQKRTNNWNQIAFLLDDESQSLLESQNQPRQLQEEIKDLEEKIKIHEYINELGPRCQEIIKLRYFEGYSLVEIGQILGINQPNIVHHRCIKRLRKKINRSTKRE